SLVDFVPAPIPDEENFYATPLFQEVITLPDGSKEFPRFKNLDIRPTNETRGGDTKGTQSSDSRGHINLEYWAARYGLRSQENQNQAVSDVILAAFDKRRDSWKELYKAAEKPRARLLINYEDMTPDPVLMAQTSVVIKLAQFLGVESLAYIDINRPKEAARDILLIFRLADSLSGQPFLISNLVKISCSPIATSKIWEGLERHVWTDDELKNFEIQLGSENLLSDMSAALRWNRGYTNYCLDRMINGDWKATKEILNLWMDGKEKEPGWWALVCYELLPIRSWLRGEMAFSTFEDQKIIDHLEMERRGINNRNTLFPAGLFEAKSGVSKWRHALFYLSVPALKGAVMKSIEAQALIDMARIACVLERYKIARGIYPEKLDQLVPDYIEKLPNDIASAKPYRYRLDAPDKFTLWSIGYDGVDDNAAPAKKRRDGEEIEKGDWVWGVFTKKSS
ncbi:MAG: hypothetical protein ABI254_07705, partial [Chthoniobacterales bacterium]